jgi:hypothetical protein
MCGRLVLVDLSKDCRPVADVRRLPSQQASRQARALSHNRQVFEKVFAQGSLIPFLERTFVLFVTLVSAKGLEC